MQASRIPALSDAPQAGDSAGDDEAQGLVSLGGQATVLLAPADVGGEVEPLAAAQRAGPSARRSPSGSTAEVDTAGVGLLLRARRTVLVQGLGSSLSGLYLVERVRHVLGVEPPPSAADARPQRARAHRRRAVRRGAREGLL